MNEWLIWIAVGAGVVVFFGGGTWLWNTLRGKGNTSN